MSKLTYCEHHLDRSNDDDDVSDDADIAIDGAGKEICNNVLAAFKH